MDLNRLRELSGQTDAAIDASVDVSTGVTPPSQVDQTPPPTPQEPVASTSTQKLDQLIVVKDPTDNSATIDDILTIVSPQELLDVIKDCGTECNFSLYPVSARAEADADAEARLYNLAGDQHEEDQLAATELDNEQMSKDEMKDPAVKEAIEVDVSPDFIPTAWKQAKQECCAEMAPEMKSRVKSLTKDIDDSLVAHELAYKHNYMHDRIDDAGTDLKMLEVLVKMKQFLLDGMVSQATTYYTSLMGPLQDKIPVSVRKFLQRGGMEVRPLTSYFKEVKRD